MSPVSRLITSILLYKEHPFPHSKNPLSTPVPQVRESHPAFHSFCAFKSLPSLGSNTATSSVLLSPTSIVAMVTQLSLSPPRSSLHVSNIAEAQLEHSRHYVHLLPSPSSPPACQKLATEGKCRNM